jgi:hypothetical protein
MAEPKIVSAVGVSANAKDKNLAKAMEAAMADAIMQAREEGITDDDEIRERMKQAREQVKAEYEARASAATAAAAKDE